MAGIENKQGNFWREMEEWDVIVLSETWISEKGWGRIKNKLPKGYRWEIQLAEKRNKKGRAIGGMLMGIRKQIWDAGTKIEKEKEGVITGKIRRGEEKWRIVGVYTGRGKLEETLDELDKWMEQNNEETFTIIKGDFNARTGREGGGVRDEEVEEKKRESKDMKIDKEGKTLINFIEERGWEIFNGNIKGDEEGEFTFTGGRGSTVIDYVIGEERVREKVERMRIGEEVDSDHQPIEIFLKGATERKSRKEGRKKKESRGVWNEKGCEIFQRRIETMIEEEEEDVDKEWIMKTNEIRRAMADTEEAKEEEGKSKRKWWDKECKEKRKEVIREIRKWRKKRGNENDYRERKKEYKEMCEKKREENERWEKKVMEAKRENEVWEIVNRERNKKKGINENIEIEEWNEYFRRLLGGVENKVVIGKAKAERREEERTGEEKIKIEEIKGVIKKLKKGKAVGIDKIPNEVWKCGGERLEIWILNFCNKVWEKKGWPEEWKEGIIVPIHKKGEGGKVEEYRGITIMPTLYRMYTAVLTGRLNEEIERKRIIPSSQAGFRRGVGTMDNIYILNYIINRQVERKGGKLIIFFIDLKAAFDSVDRKVLIDTLKERGIRGGIIERIEEVLRETKSKVKIGEEESKSFWTIRGVRQGCPLSPILFNILISDIEEEMSKVKWGGVRIGGEKLHTLAYADDVALIAENKDEMRSMISRMEEYLDKKGLILNTEKSKIMRCKKGGGRDSKVKMRWKGKIIEEVKEFKYLGYTIQTNGGQEAHVKDRVKKAAAIMGQIWGIGRRRYDKDWGRKLWLFDKLVWTVMSYGVEIWGWKERVKMESLEERYLKWLLGVERTTPGYLVREEMQRDKLKGVAGRRAWGFEKRLEEGRGSEWTKKCWEEIKQRSREGKKESGWEKERREYFEEKGIKIEEVEKKKGEEGWFGELIEREKEEQKKERWEKINDSRYNKWYKRIKGEGIPEYLKKGWGRSRCQRIARYRLGGEVKESKYWENEEKKKCRICEGDKETWEHVWEECIRWESFSGSWQEKVEWVLGEKGEGEEWMRKMDEERENRENKEKREKENEWENERERMED